MSTPRIEPRGLPRTAYVLVGVVLLVLGGLLLGALVYVDAEEDRDRREQAVVDNTLEIAQSLEAASERSDCRAIITAQSDLEFRTGLTNALVALTETDPAVRTQKFAEAVGQMEAVQPLTQKDIDDRCGPTPRAPNR